MTLGLVAIRLVWAGTKTYKFSFLLCAGPLSDLALQNLCPNINRIWRCLTCRCRFRDLRLQSIGGGADEVMLRKDYLICQICKFVYGSRDIGCRIPVGEFELLFREEKIEVGLGKVLIEPIECITLDFIQVKSISRGHFGSSCGVGI